MIFTWEEFRSQLDIAVLACAGADQPTIERTFDAFRDSVAHDSPERTAMLHCLAWERLLSLMASETDRQEWDERLREAWDLDFEDAWVEYSIMYNVTQQLARRKHEMTRLALERVRRALSKLHAEQPPTGLVTDLERLESLVERHMEPD